MAYELVEHIEVGAGGAASIEFTSIPQDGVDLVLKLSTRSNRSNSTVDNTVIRLNGSTATVNSWRVLQGTGSAVNSSSASGANNQQIINNANTATTSTFGSVDVYISNYSSSANKSLSFDGVTENNATVSYQEIRAGLWADTTPITSLVITTAVGTAFLEHSTASLYKIY